MAPFTPFIAEEVYQAVKEADDPESVHLTGWPETEGKDEEVLDAMGLVRDIVSDGLQKRAEAKIKVRQPLASVTIQKELEGEYQELIQEELNVKKVLTDQKQDTLSKLDTTLTDELKEEGDFRGIIRNTQEKRKKDDLTPEDKVSTKIWGDAEIVNLMNKKNYLEEFKIATNSAEVQILPLQSDSEEDLTKEGDRVYKVSIEK